MMIYIQLASICESLATGRNLTRSTSKTSEEQEEWEDFTNTNRISAQLQADLFGQDLSLMSSVRFNKAVYVMCASTYQKKPFAYT